MTLNIYDRFLPKGSDPNPNPGHYGVPVVQREVAMACGGLGGFSALNVGASKRVDSLIVKGIKLRMDGNPRWGETILEIIDPEKFLDGKTKLHIGDALSVGYFLLVESSLNYAAGHPCGPSGVSNLRDVANYLERRLGSEAAPLIEVINSSAKARKISDIKAEESAKNAASEAVRNFRKEIEARDDSRTNSELLRGFRESIELRAYR